MLVSAPMAACCRPEDGADGAWSKVKSTVPAMATPQPSQTRRPGRSPARDDRVGVTNDVTCTIQYCSCWMPSHATHMLVFHMCANVIGEVLLT